MKNKKIISEKYEKNLLRNILKPNPKIKLAQRIAEKHLLTACIDNSDGLYPSLIQLAHLNNLEMQLAMDNIEYSDEVKFISDNTGIEPIRFALGWGDWQLIGCCAQQNLDELQKLASEYRENVTVIGEVKQGQNVVLSYQGKIDKMFPIDSQRFT